MNGFDPPDDYDCGCRTFSSCAYHKAEAQRREDEARADARRQGWNPDAEVDEHMCELMLTVETSPVLSDYQKLAIRRIVFPVR